MDNNAFENKMIHTVNTHADAVKHNRMVAESEAMEERKINRKVEVFRAVVCIILWLACFVTCVYSMWAMCFIGKMSNAVAMTITSVFGFVVGMRVNALANVIKK